MNSHWRKWKAAGAIWLAVFVLASVPCLAAPGFDARSTKEQVLFGFHYGDMANHEGRNETDHPLNIWPYLEDYFKYMEDDLLKTSYADLWRWWYVLERYKGDEKGLVYLDGLVDELLKRG